MKIVKLLNCYIVKVFLRFGVPRRGITSRGIFVFLCFCVFVFSVFIAGCAPKVVDSELDWPVEGVQTVNDNREVKVAIPQNVTGTVEIAAPDNASAEVKKEKEVGEVEIINPSGDVSELNSVTDSPVPFISQAPYAVWDDLHNEACEEAAMIMADVWFSGKNLTAHTMEQGILSLVKWEEENGYTIDVTAIQTVEILQKYFGLRAELIADVSASRIKQEIQAGKLVIIPAAGRLLGNPYFRSPGPLYHMLIIRGFDESRGEFITNDPGTRKGEAYRYQYETLINAIHDWPKPGRTKDDVTEAEMNAGQKALIVVEK